MSKRFKKYVAVISAIAMIIAGITYTPKTVSASGSATVDGITYTVTDGTAGDWTGVTCQGIFDSLRIHFAWGIAVEAESITVSVNGTSMTVHGKNANGCYIFLADAKAACGNGTNGTYTITLGATKSSDSSLLTWDASLAISGGSSSETTTADSSGATWIEDTYHDGWIRWNPSGDPVTEDTTKWGMGSWSALGNHFAYSYDYDSSLFAIKNNTGAANDVWIASPKTNYEASTQYYYRYVLKSTVAFTGNVYVQGYSTGWGEQTHAAVSYTAGGDTVISGTTTTNDNQITSIAISLKILGVPSNAIVSVESAYFSTTPYGEATTAEQTTEEGALKAPSKVVAYNFYGNGEGYQVNFVKGDDNAVSYNLYVDSDTTPVATFNAAECTQISEKSGKVTLTAPSKFAQNLFTSYANGSDGEHSLYVEAVDSSGNKAKSSAGKVFITTAETNTSYSTDPSDVSRIYITSVTNSQGLTLDQYTGATKSDSKQDAALTIIKGSGALESVSDFGTVKLRGNSTAYAAKKAYNITFNSKKTVMSGKSSGKKWCLLANAYEKTMMRNKLAMDFGALLGNVATPKEYYADVYVNGVYKGTFVVSEPADNGRAGVSYGDNENDVLFEYENNDRDESADGVAYYTTNATTGYGIRFVNEEFEDEVLALYEGGTTSINGIATALYGNGTTKFAKWANTLDSFEAAIKANNSLTIEQLGNYIDVDSFVDMYIINELFKTVDFAYSSVKFYVKYDANGENPVIYAGPLWDFDLSSGNTVTNEIRPADSGLRAQENAWFGALMSNENFANAVKAKYKTMQPQIQNLYMDNTLGTNRIDANVSEMGQSRVRNYSTAGWSETVADEYERTGWQYSYCLVSPYNTYTYTQHVEYLREWLRTRNEYLSSLWITDEGTVGDWQTIPTNGWQYKGATNVVSAITYTNGTTWDDYPTFNVTKNNAWTEGDFQVRTPVKSVTAGTYNVKLTFNESNATSANFFRLCKSDGTVLETSETIGSTANLNNEITLQYTFAEDMDVYLEFIQNYSAQGSKTIFASITSTSEETTTEAETTTEEETTAPEWTPVTNNASWDTVGEWHLFAGTDVENGYNMSYKGSGDPYKDLTLKIDSLGGGDWYQLQAGINLGLEVGKTYDYEIKYTTTQAGNGVAFSINGNSEIYKSSTVGENTFSGVVSYKNHPTEKYQLVFLPLGLNAGAQVRITSISFVEHVNIDEEVGDNIANGKDWIKTVENEGWNKTSITTYDGSGNVTGYNLSTARINNSWYTTQTIMENIVFNAGSKYKLKFRLETTTPKTFIIDDQQDEGNTFFVEDTSDANDSGEWKYDSETEKYYYDYVGNYNATTTTASNLRISWGYNASDSTYGLYDTNRLGTSVDGTAKATDADYGFTQASSISVTLKLFEVDVTETSAKKVEEITGSDQLKVEGFQIRTNDTSNSVAFRTVCKAPTPGQSITVDGDTYTVDKIGTIYALDIGQTSGIYDDGTAAITQPNKATLLYPGEIAGQQYKYYGLDSYKNVTFGYVAADRDSTSGSAVLNAWDETAEGYTYYAYTMQGMDAVLGNTLYVRAFVVATDGTFIYGPRTAVTCVAEIADYLYTNNYANNYTAHNYLYSAILNQNSISTNRFYRNSIVEFGWDDNLYTKDGILSQQNGLNANSGQNALNWTNGY